MWKWKIINYFILFIIFIVYMWLEYNQLCVRLLKKGIEQKECDDAYKKYLNDKEVVIRKHLYQQYFKNLNLYYKKILGIYTISYIIASLLFNNFFIIICIISFLIFIFEKRLKINHREEIRKIEKEIEYKIIIASKKYIEQKGNMRLDEEYKK